jgi:hypothetical protein
MPTIYSSKRMKKEMENKEYNLINNSHESLMAENVITNKPSSLKISS